MNSLNRISQPAGLMGFSQQRRNDPDDTFEQYGWTARNKAREASAPPPGRGFASILERMIEA